MKAKLKRAFRYARKHKLFYKAFIVITTLALIGTSILPYIL